MCHRPSYLPVFLAALAPVAFLAADRAELFLTFAEELLAFLVATFLVAAFLVAAFLVAAFLVGAFLVAAFLVVVAFSAVVFALTATSGLASLALTCRVGFVAPVKAISSIRTLVKS